jgi:hypothetical protein
MIDVSRLVAKKNTAPLPGQARFEAWGSKPPVEDSEDLTRIVELSRRSIPDSTKGEALVEYITELYARENPTCKCASLGRECIKTLRPVQAWALHEIATTGGLLGAIGVGHGKTILDLLSPLALQGCTTVVVLVPPTLVDQLVEAYELVGQHFRMPGLQVHGRGIYFDVPGAPILHVFPYSRLSHEKATDFLESLAPDAIVADEVHMLRHAGAVRTSRVLRYFKAHPETKFCGWSGSLTDSSIKDYWHLSALALRGGSPLPLHPEAVEDWSRALDPSDNPAPAGALIALCHPGEHVQAAYSRRLVDTQGFVSTQEPAINADLILSERKAPPIPAEVKEALKNLRATWTRPDGEELVEALAVARCAWQLAAGFYYRWTFPRGERILDIVEWLEARKEWRRELRERLNRPQPFMDSPQLLARAAARAWREVPYAGDKPVWRAVTWPRWKAAKGTVVPETEAVRIDPFLAQDAADWGRDNRGVVWVAHKAFGVWIAELSGMTFHGAGKDAGRLIGREKGDKSIIASIKAHGTGRDGLQFKFFDQLVANPPASATPWEQLLGRLHRIGQPSPVVKASFYRHTPEVQQHVDQALLRAGYIERTMQARQKILIAGMESTPQTL